MAKFGFGQIGKPTPQKWALVCEFLAGICGIIGGWMVTAAFIPNSVSNILSSILTGLGVPIFLLLKRMIGSETESKRVDVEKVSEIKTE